MNKYERPRTIVFPWIIFWIIIWIIVWAKLWDTCTPSQDTQAIQAQLSDIAMSQENIFQLSESVLCTKK